MQLLGSISEMSLRSLASRADILRQGWSLRRTKPSSLQDGWEAPLHRYFTTVRHISALFFFWLPVFLSSVSSALFWCLVFTGHTSTFETLKLQQQCMAGMQSRGHVFCIVLLLLRYASCWSCNVDMQMVVQSLFGSCSGLRKWRSCTSQYSDATERRSCVCRKHSAPPPRLSHCLLSLSFGRKH